MAKRAGKSGKAVRVGVVGLRRGESLALRTKAAGLEVVAICDTLAPRLDKAAAGLKVTPYDDFEKFLAHDMDAVVLANYFHQHAPLAIRALDAGLHVLSETAACFTLAEGVALVEAVERSGRVYMIAENYPYMLFNQEMRRLYAAGRIGQFVYGEGEYVHPGDADFCNSIAPGHAHWRNWLPATYYCTHSLAPLMYITDTMPTKVNGFIVPRPADDPVAQRIVRRNDGASMIVLRMDNGAVVKLLQVHLRGESIWVRVHGSRGQMENLRTGDTRMVRLRREQYHESGREPFEQIYLPRWPAGHEKAAGSGHGGGDYFVCSEFVEAIRRGRQPYLDVYRAVAMSVIGPLAWRSALSDSGTLEVPDFRKPAVRRKYANDHWAPDVTGQGKGKVPYSITGRVTPSAEAVAYAEAVWKRG